MRLITHQQKHTMVKKSFPCLFFRFYLILLSKHSKNSRRKRSTSESNPSCSKDSLKYSYDKAMEKKLSCYTTAEISSDKVEGNYPFVVGDGISYGVFYNAPVEVGATYDLYMAGKVVDKVCVLPLEVL